MAKRYFNDIPPFNPKPHVSVFNCDHICRREINVHTWNSLYYLPFTDRPVEILYAVYYSYENVFFTSIHVYYTADSLGMFFKTFSC